MKRKIYIPLLAVALVVSSALMLSALTGAAGDEPPDDVAAVYARDAITEYAYSGDCCPVVYAPVFVDLLTEITDCLVAYLATISEDMMRVLRGDLCQQDAYVALYAFLRTLDTEAVQRGDLAIGQHYVITDLGTAIQFYLLNGLRGAALALYQENTLNHSTRCHSSRLTSRFGSSGRLSCAMNEKIAELSDLIFITRMGCTEIDWIQICIDTDCPFISETGYPEVFDLIDLINDFGTPQAFVESLRGMSARH